MEEPLVEVARHLGGERFEVLLQCLDPRGRLDHLLIGRLTRNPLAGKVVGVVAVEAASASASPVAISTSRCTLHRRSGSGSSIH